MQQALFCEAVYDALRAAVSAAGGPKVVGSLLWPAKSPDAARVALLDALNPSRPEKLALERLQRKGRAPR